MHIFYEVIQSKKEKKKDIYPIVCKISFFVSFIYFVTT